MWQVRHCTQSKEELVRPLAQHNASPGPTRSNLPFVLNPLSAQTRWDGMGWCIVPRVTRFAGGYSTDILIIFISSHGLSFFGFTLTFSMLWMMSSPAVALPKILTVSEALKGARTCACRQAKYMGPAIISTQSHVDITRHLLWLRRTGSRSSPDLRVSVHML